MSKAKNLLNKINESKLNTKKEVISEDKITGLIEMSDHEIIVLWDNKDPSVVEKGAPGWNDIDTLAQRLNLKRNQVTKLSQVNKFKKEAGLL